MKYLTGFLKRIWVEMTLTWTRPVVVVALIVVSAMSSEEGVLGEASPFALIAVAVVLAPIESKLARKAHRRRGTPRPSNRGLTIRGGLCAILTALCVIAAYFSYQDHDSQGIDALGGLAALFAALTWLYLFSLKREAMREGAATAAEAPEATEAKPGAGSGAA